MNRTEQNITAATMIKRGAKQANSRFIYDMYINVYDTAV